MNEEYHYENYETASQPEEAVSSVTAVQKKKPIGSIIGIIICALVILCSGAAFFALQNTQKETGTEQNPEDIYLAEDDGQYSYALLQCMTEPFASFEMYEKQQFYFVFDEEFYPAIVCMDDAAAEELYAYIEYTYTDDESYPAPEVRELTGYSMKIDSELADFAIESYYEIFGYQYTEEEFYEDFGYCYLNMGENVAASQESAASTPALIVLLAAAVLLVIFIISYKKAVSRKDSGSFIDVEMSRAVPGEKINVNVGAGIAGAFLGAALGGILWVIVGMFGYIVGWLGILIVVLAITGYKKLGKGLDKTGVAISIVISLVMIVAAEYAAWALLYYREVNDGIAGISLTEAFKELPAAMTSMDLWGSMAGDIAIGFVLTGVAALYCLPSYLKGGASQSQLNAQVVPKFGKATAIMLVTVFGSLFIGLAMMAMGSDDEGVALILIGFVLMLGGVLIPLIVYCVSAQKKWKKAVFYNTEQFRIGRNLKGELRSYGDIVSMNQDEEGNYAIRMYSGDVITVPAAYKGADEFAKLVREKLAEQI